MGHEIVDSELDDVTPDTLPGTASPALRRRAGIFARRQAQRITREDLVRRARMLPPLPQAILTAYYDRGVSLSELSLLHNLPRQRMYRLLVHWRDVLSDRSFLLAAQLADRLPASLAQLARDHWLEGRTLRDLARARNTTLHDIRTRLAEARESLMAAAAQLRDARTWGDE